MSPGKWSRPSKTPNKPPVCHKGPRIKLPIALPPWMYVANLFFKWQGSPPQGNDYRSWALKLDPTPGFPTMRAAGTTAGITFQLNLTLTDPVAKYRYAVVVRSPALILLQHEILFTPLQQVHPWDTGLVDCTSSYMTLSCFFEAMA